MQQIDKIIQIVKGDETYSIHGLSESGKLYYIAVTEQGDHYWKYVCDSPMVNKKIPRIFHKKL